MRAALGIDPKLSVLVVTKGDLSQSNSINAQGGIASVLGPNDRIEDHVADTLLAGGTLCDRSVVERIISEGPARIKELVDWGTNFDQSDGSLALTREGGHGRERVVHALGDATGKEVMRVVGDRVCRAAHIESWQDTFCLDLLTHEGTCRGALVWNGWHGKTLIWAKQTILATGGTGQIYRETTNPDVATGDGMAIAYRAGAELRDMEFVQFHPTVLYIAGSSRHLITEAMRGEGAYLVDRNGYRFMPEIDDRAELAPRDVVSWAISNQMERTRHPNVYLELTHLEAGWIRRRFPGIAAICAKFGLDITRDRIPVRPGAHYMMGGVTIDAECRTAIPGLWAAGEVTSSGLHGANRLASNSLLEAVVHGVSVGRAVSRAAAEMPDDFRALPLQNACREPDGEPLDLADIRNSLKSLMWRNVGVRRDADGLREALDNVERWSSYVLKQQFAEPNGWELQNMLCVTRLMIKAALNREETRGCHVRTDYPDLDDKNWNRHTTFTQVSGRS